MIKKLGALLGDVLGDSIVGGDTDAVPALANAPAEHTLRLACTVLMFEVLRADMKTTPAELDTVRRHLTRAYGLDETQTEQLMRHSAAESAERVSMHDLVRAINREYGPAQKRALVKALWDVAYADGELDKHEEHTIRKLADWLHVPHRHFIQTKHEAGGDN